MAGKTCAFLLPIVSSLDVSEVRMVRVARDIPGKLHLIAFPSFPSFPPFIRSILHLFIHSSIHVFVYSLICYLIYFFVCVTMYLLYQYIDICVFAH